MATEMELRKELAIIAKKDLGISEPNGDDSLIDFYNKIRDKGAYKVKHTDAWCGVAWTVWVYKSKARSIGAIDAYVPFLDKKLKKNGAIEKPRDYIPQVADTVMYNWGNGLAHIGLVLSCDGKNVWVIEGNKNDTPDKVAIRKIPIGWKFIDHYLVLDWDKIADKITVSSWWDRETTKATQELLGTVADGEVWNQYKPCIKYLLNIDNNNPAKKPSWRFTTKKTKGSPMVKALQQYIGMAKWRCDGLMGKNTVYYLQKFLNTHGYGLKVDGYLGPKTVRAWQLYLVEVM